MNVDNIGKIAGIGSRIATTFIKSQENLSSTRFIQDTATNWLPKAVFARSKADLAEMSFLEFIESALFYFAFPILGEGLYRKGLFKALQPKNLKEAVNKELPNKVSEIIKNKDITQNVKNSALTTKAGILLACLAIPVAEYTLSFAKNLFTLKTFKKSNFNNIASLDETEREDIKQQEKVEKSSKRQIKKAGILSLLGLAAGVILAKFGKNSQKLVNLSANILEPGKAIVNKLNPKNEKLRNALNSFSLDFANQNGKLALSKGQLGLTALVGLFGYSAAASDRGKLDVAEVWTRVPLVVLYTTFGSELLEKGFIKHLSKNPKYSDLIQKDALGKLTVPELKDLAELAQKIAPKNGLDIKEQYKKLLSQKTLTTAVPYAFSIIVMGFILSGMTRFWTKYRYKHLPKNKQFDSVLSFRKNLPDIYKVFQK